MTVNIKLKINSRKLAYDKTLNTDEWMQKIRDS